MNNKILCVDDEDSILRGFQLNLRKDFELHLARDGVEGLEVFDKEGGFALVLSDMRMPRMNGAEMLAEIKKRDNEVSTILLTGHTDFDSAMAAVNDGNVFRMLSKPCPPERLIKVLNDGLEQHDLIKSKRILKWSQCKRIRKWAMRALLAASKQQCAKLHNNHHPKQLRV